MEKKILFGSWFFLTLLAAAIVLSYRRKHQTNRSLELIEVQRITLAVLGSLSGLLLFYKTGTEFDKLEPIVGLEGLVSMCIGGLTTIWFGITEIAGLTADKSSKP
jgi:hypothetical protein